MQKIDISDVAFHYLKSLAEPLTDTTVSVFDRIVEEHRKIKLIPAQVITGALPSYGIRNCPSVKFTSIVGASVNGSRSAQNSWNHILEATISACIEKDQPSSKVMDAMIANVSPGRHITNGFRYVPSAGFSFQGLEANRACKNVMALAEKFGVKVEVDVKWQENEDAAFPNQSTKLVFP